MSSLRKVLASSVATKVTIALTGLLLFLFLVAHLAGNLLILAGPETFNHYSHKLVANPALLYAAEIGLLVVFLVHVGRALTNAWHNRAARPVGYASKERAGDPSRVTVASTTMVYTGLFIFVFLVLHLRTFKWGPWYDVGGIRDLAKLEYEVFSNPAYVVFYVVSMALVGLHLRHGFSSAFQSLGADHPTVTPWLLRLGVLLAVLIAGGFALLPIAVYVLGGRS